VVCSGIPDTTQQIDLYNFLVEQFGEISDIWLEDRNGYEQRQGIVFFTSPYRVRQATSTKKILHFKNQPISFEQCSEKLNEIIKMRFQLLEEPNSNETWGVLKPNYINAISEFDQVIMRNRAAHRHSAKASDGG
ncbi:MAG: hypothetical protein EZS28_052178, partial [Streblomastix strix]